MRLDSSSDEYASAIILLDGRRVMGVLEADDGEGWVDILDPTSLAPLVDLSEEESEDIDFSLVEEWEEAKTIRKFGKVTFILPKK